MTVEPRSLLRQGEGRPGLASFQWVYASEFPYVWNSARRLGVAEADLPDVTHDIFVQAFRSLPEYDTARPLRPWLFGIALRVVSDFRRLERHRREVLGQPIEAVDPARSATETLEAADDRRLVQAILNEMKLNRRTVFIMHELNGHSVREIADALAIPLPTVYTRLRLAMLEFGRKARRYKLLGESS
jgi:RNA polymerase sigma-70 factor (ECF subfamily)